MHVFQRGARVRRRLARVLVGLATVALAGGLILVAAASIDRGSSAPVQAFLPPFEALPALLQPLARPSPEASASPSEGAGTATPAPQSALGAIIGAVRTITSGGAPAAATAAPSAAAATPQPTPPPLLLTPTPVPAATPTHGPPTIFPGQTPPPHPTR